MSIVNFNIVDIIILGLIALAVVSGMYKGFIASGLAGVGFVAAGYGAFSLYPQLATAIQGNASLMSVLSYYLDAGSLFSNSALGDTVVNSATAASQTMSDALNALKLPDLIKTQLNANVNQQLFAKLGLTTLSEYLNQTIWGVVINVVSFLALFAIGYLVVLLVVNLLNNVFHFPLLRHFDWLLGGVFGFLRGYIFVMLLLAVMPMAMAILPPLDIIQKMIDQSQLAQFASVPYAQKLLTSVVELAFKAAG